LVGLIQCGYALIKFEVIVVSGFFLSTVFIITILIY
jgi:hypothetical protein